MAAQVLSSASSVHSFSSSDEALPSYSGGDRAPRYSWASGDVNADARSIRSLAPSYHTVDDAGVAGAVAGAVTGTAAAQPEPRIRHTELPASLALFAQPSAACPFYTPQRKALDQIARRRAQTQRLQAVYTQMMAQRQRQARMRAHLQEEMQRDPAVEEFRQCLTEHDLQAHPELMVLGYTPQALSRLRAEAARRSLTQNLGLLDLDESTDSGSSTPRPSTPVAGRRNPGSEAVAAEERTEAHGEHVGRDAPEPVPRRTRAKTVSMAAPVHHGTEHVPSLPRRPGGARAYTHTGMPRPDFKPSHDPLMEDAAAWDHFIQQGGLARSV